MCQPLGSRAVLRYLFAAGLLGLLGGFQPVPAAPPASLGTGVFPCPPALAPRVNFWVRIFTEFEGHQRVIHDARYPWIVYEVLDVTDLDQKAIKAKVGQRKEYYGHLLERLASRPASLWSAEERRVAALLDSVPEGARFTGARERVRSQPGIKEQFRLGLQRAGRFQDAMHAVLDSIGVPRELACLPHVESSYHPGAVSKAGAVGLWQFMPATGRRYLRVQNDLDERLDPIRATEAAARYLKDAQRELGSWPLAVVSYNHGVAGVSRARRARPDRPRSTGSCWATTDPVLASPRRISTVSFWPPLRCRAASRSTSAARWRLICH